MTAPSPRLTPSRFSLALRALAAWVAMGFGLGFSGPVAEALADQVGFGRTGRQAVTAVLVSLIVVSIVFGLCRLDRRPLASLGFGAAVPSSRSSGSDRSGSSSRSFGSDAAASSFRSFGLGVLVTGGCAAAVIVPAGFGGWIDFGPVDWPALGLFLVVNALIAFGLEALPEEMVFRGYVYSTLAQRGRKSAFVFTTALFALIMIPTSAATAATVLLFGGDPEGLMLAPSGQDPVTYMVLMVFFGTTLLTARIATGSLWASIAVHLTFLTVNRLVFANADRDTGWQVEAAPDAAVLVLAYLVLTTVVFAVLKRRSRTAAGRARR